MLNLAERQLGCVLKHTEENGFLIKFADYVERLVHQFRRAVNDKRTVSVLLLLLFLSERVKFCFLRSSPGLQDYRGGKELGDFE